MSGETTSGCRWGGSDRPRIVPKRHANGCDDEDCRGCQPCTEAHCRVCGIEHHAGACPGCLAAARESLAEIVRLCGSLPAEVEHHGVHGEAMNLLGPAVNVEAWGHRQASAKAGRIDASWLEDGTDERHPLIVLGTIEMVVRDARDDVSDERVTVQGAAAYLDRMLTEMGADPHLPFEDFARDLRGCVSHMELVLHDGEQIEKGAPCPECGRHLLHQYGARMVDDTWKCPSRRCGIEYTTREYRGWVEEDARNEADRLTAEDMALRFDDLKASIVRVWGSRDLIRKRGRDRHGMTLYDVADVEAKLSARQSA